MNRGSPVMCTPTTGTNRPRAGDTNSFRLIPIGFEAGYRYTQLDDDWGIPIVPYARGGLAYDVWWVNAPSGSFATALIPSTLRR